MTKIVSATSAKTLIESRVDLSDGPVGLLWLAGLGTPVLSFIATNISLALAAMPEGDASLIGLAVAVVSAPVAVSAIHSHTVAAEIQEYTGTSVGKRGKLKAMFAMLTPFGQKMETGKKSLRVSGNIPAHLLGGKKSFSEYSGYYRSHRDSWDEKSFRDAELTHEVETELVFRPLGVYIKQTVSPSAINIWDEAFKSTVEVHRFNKSKKVEAKKLQLSLSDAPF